MAVPQTGLRYAMVLNMNEKTLYLDCSSGISGDMTVAALLDLGADRQVLQNGLKSLNVDGYRINISRKNKSGIEACDFDVILENDSAYENDHNSEENLPEHLHVKLGRHENRNLYDIITIIDNSDHQQTRKNLQKIYFI
ncbi:MAG: nickel insertion protein [Anaerocolumna sp.]